MIYINKTSVENNRVIPLEQNRQIHYKPMPNVNYRHFSPNNNAEYTEIYPSQYIHEN